MTRDYSVPMLTHAFNILEILFEEEKPLALQDISHRAGVNKSSAFRIMFTLEKFGYVHKGAKKGMYVSNVRLAPGVQSVLFERRLIVTSRPYLTALWKQFNETVNLGVLRDNEIVYLEILESSYRFRMADAVGASVPLHSTALGKSVAAFLPKKNLLTLLRGAKMSRITPNSICRRNDFFAALERVRKLGYSLDDEETELGASCIGVAILGTGRFPMAAISISGPTPRIHATEKEAITALKKAALSISRRMTSVPFGSDTRLVMRASETGETI